MHGTSTRPRPIASGSAQVLILLGIAALTSTPIGCSSSTTCEESGSCANANPGSGGDDAGSDADGSTPAPSDCDLAADPKDAPACVDDTVGVFVDGSSGLDSNPGTKAAPLRSIGAALEKLGARKRVYVCGEGPYEEQVTLTTGVSLYGGFVCTSWTYNGTKARIAPNGPGYALHVAGVASPVVITDFAFAAKDAVEPGGSSIAVFLADSANVTLRRVHASAGKGMDAEAAPAPPSNLYVGSLEGNTATGPTGAPANICACNVYGSSTGGKGGDAGNPAADGDPGAATPKPADMPDYRDGLGGLGYPKNKGKCESGNVGADGAARAAGTGAAKLGALTASGWAPEPGSDGEAGNPGGGGGGGGGGETAGGGGGGCGGCGGSGGKGGKGGGASIALTTLNTTLHLDTVAAQASDAGKGGNASGGGGGGGGGGTGGACGGGKGGNGAGGGGAGGGAGGISAGILRSGGALDGSPEVTLGNPGGGGAGAEGGSGGANSLSTAPSGLDGPAGKDGVAEAVLVLE